MALARGGAREMAAAEGKERRGGLHARDGGRSQEVEERGAQACGTQDQIN